MYLLLADCRNPNQSEAEFTEGKSTIRNSSIPAYPVTQQGAQNVVNKSRNSIFSLSGINLPVIGFQGVQQQADNGHQSHTAGHRRDVG